MVRIKLRCSKPALLLFALVTHASGADAQNLVTNGFFDTSVSFWIKPIEYATAIQTAWKAGPDATANATSGYARATAVPANYYRAGMRSECISILPATRKRIFRFSGYGRNVSGPVYSREIVWKAHKSGLCSSSGADVEGSFKKYYYHSTATTPWERVDQAFNVPADTITMSVRLEAQCGSANGSQQVCVADFDNIVLEAALFDDGLE